MSDYIDRQAAIDMLHRMSDVEWNKNTLTTWANACEEAADLVECLPSADLNEIMICGYPARHLAFVATVMQKEGMSPEEVASCLRDVGRMVGLIMAEQKEIVEKTWKEWGAI